MIQDIETKLQNEYQHIQPEETDEILVFDKRKICLKVTMQGLRFLQKSDLAQVFDAYSEKELTYQYLFCIGQRNYFLFTGFPMETLRASKTCTFMEMSAARQELPKEMCFALYTAYHLYQWYRDNQYCGRCGKAVVPDTKERMLYCTSCGNQIYPKIAPAVIVAVTHGDKILLTKYAGREYQKYALIAGFTEIGETAEQTVKREVLEEVGLHVKNIRYYKTQPWGIDSNLLIGYFAELEQEDVLCLDHKELAMAKWFDREDLQDMDDGISLTREMMRVFYEGKEPKETVQK